MDPITIVYFAAALASAINSQPSNGIEKQVVEGQLQAIEKFSSSANERDASLKQDEPLFSKWDHGDVSREEFYSYIELVCNRTVDCYDHQAVMGAMRRAEITLSISDNQLVQLGYLDVCRDSIAILSDLPPSMGNPGVYQPQLDACNAGLVYHFLN